MHRAVALGTVVIAGALGVASSRPALAANSLPNDLQVYRLLGPSGSTAQDGSQSRFRLLGDELGMSLASTTLEPAHTLGIDGFDFGFETSFAFINAQTQLAGQPYWVTTNSAPSALVIPAIHFRKGLPYSLEIGGRISTIGDSNMYAGQAELKWGILEGFRYLPDLSARFYMTRLFGQNDFDSTSGALDFTLGKEFGVAGLFTLSPYLGYALTGVDTSSRVFWANPNTTESSFQSNPVSSQQVFAEETWNNNLYDRFYAGLMLTASIVSFNVEYSYSRPSGFSAQPFPATIPADPGLSTLGLRIALTL